MKPRSRTVLTLQSLESREVPAVTIVNATTATFTDIDGDKATVKVSVGTLTAGLFTTAATGLGEQLQTIDFSLGSFDGTNLSVTAIKVPTGDGLVNVGYINSTMHDLGTVTIAGDLGQVDAGDSDPAAPAITSLNVRSLGRYGIDTQAAGGSLESNLSGALNSLTVKVDVTGAYLNVDDGADGKIGSVSIGGSLIGGSSTASGRIFSSGDMGLVKIGHDLQGGTGGSSGAISTLTKLAGVTIGGSVIGGTGINSGQAFSFSDMGPVKIAHDLKGGAGGASGVLSVNGKLASATIGGSVIGGTAAFSGAILGTLDMGPVKIGHDLLGGAANSSGQVASDGKLAGLSVAGSVIGGAGNTSGSVIVIGDVGLVKIGYDLHGGSGVDAGLIKSSGKIAGVTIGGSILGGSNDNTGKVFSGGDMGTVKIGHDLIGGAGQLSGTIDCGDKLAGVSVGGSLIGGLNNFSGVIYCSVDIGPVKIGHDLIGGSITAAASLNFSGMIESNSGRISSVAVGGSIISGIDNSTGALTNNASIRAGNDIGSLTVTGSIIGNTNANGDSPVIISARGQAVPSATKDVAIGKLSIGRRVENTRILAGYDISLTPKNADAQIGAITVGGDWIGSSIAAGVVDGGNGFGNGNDVAIAGGSAAIVSKIGSITIKGLVHGTPGAAADHFGFVAQQIGSFKALGFTALLTAGTDVALELALTTGDVTIREVV